MVVKEPIWLTRLSAMASDGFGDFVKAVVDIEQRVMAVDNPKLSLLCHMVAAI